jgi:hypothetical protein
LGEQPVGKYVVQQKLELFTIQGKLHLNPKHLTTLQSAACLIVFLTDHDQIRLMDDYFSALRRFAPKYARRGNITKWLVGAKRITQNIKSQMQQKNIRRRRFMGKGLSCKSSENCKACMDAAWRPSPLQRGRRMQETEDKKISISEK